MLQRVFLEDVCEKITDGSHNPPKQVEHSKYLMLSSKNVLDNIITFDKPRYLSEKDFSAENKRTNLEVGDVLLTIVGTVGRCAVVEKLDRKITLQRSVAVLKPKKDLIISRYLMFLLQSFSDDLNKKARGVAQKGVYLKSIRKILINLPPLEEQHNIVAKLDIAFNDIDLATKVVEKNMENINVFFQKFLDTQIFKNEKKYDKYLIDQICFLGDGNHSSKYPKKKEMKSSGIPFLRSTNIVDGKISDSDLIYISQEKHNELKKGHIKEDDLLLTNRGGIGEVAMVDKRFNDSNINSQLAWLRSKGEVLNKYLYYVFLSTSIKNIIKKAKSGTALPQLTMNEIKRIKVPLPSIIEQKKQLDKFSYLEISKNELSLALSKKRDCLISLKKSTISNYLQNNIDF